LTSTKSPRRCARALAFGLLSALAVAPGITSERAALAQAPAKASPDAERDFQRGLARFRESDYAGAIAAWEALMARVGEDAAWRTLYGLGLAYEAMGDATRAVERFEGFLAHLAKETTELSHDVEERRQDAAERAKKLRATHAGLRVVAPPGGERVTVRVGDDPPREAPFWIVRADGPVALVIAPGTPRERRVALSLILGQTLEVVALPAGGPGDRAPLISLVDPPQFPTAIVIAGGVATLVSLSLPIALGSHAGSLRDQAMSYGPGSSLYAPAVSSFQGARSAYYASWAAPIALGLVTASVAIVGAVLVEKHKVRGLPLGPSVGLLNGLNGLNNLNGIGMDGCVVHF
jgi:tetratricopeptide (TPR) repeat protein